MFPDTHRECVTQQTVIPIGVDRILKFRLSWRITREEAPEPRRTKSNGISITSVLGRSVELLPERSKGNGQISYYILTANCRVASVLVSTSFASARTCSATLVDLGPACTGPIGIATVRQYQPEGHFRRCCEPVHGSAPDIAGQGTPTRSS